MGGSPPLRVVFVCDPTMPRAIAGCTNSVGKLRVQIESERCKVTPKLGVVRRHPWVHSIGSQTKRPV